MKCIIYGKHSALECIKNKKRKIVKLWCTRSFALENEALIKNLDPEIVPSEKLNTISGGGTHQGVVVQALPLPHVEESFLHRCRRIAILDKVEDPHNVGAVMRSAAAFRFDALVILRGSMPEHSSTIAKVASGALEHVNFVQAANLARLARELKRQNFWVIGLDCSAKQELSSSVIKAEKVALVLGGESQGIRRLVKSECDVLVRIPTEGSLNVSNAAAIAFYEARLY